MGRIVEPKPRKITNLPTPPLKTEVFEPPYKAIRTMLRSYKSIWHYGEKKKNGRGNMYPNAEIVADSIEKWLLQMEELK